MQRFSTTTMIFAVLAAACLVSAATAQQVTVSIKNDSDYPAQV